jgi:predicted phage-related endonuclease
MGFGNKVVTPEDIYGKDHFKKTFGDFYPRVDIFGGMWDALIMGDDGKPEYVVEIKTVQVDGRSGSLEERWKDGEAPHYQALQASLYAYLLGIDKVLMVAVALENKKGDYEHPELVVPSYANENVHVDEFRVSERYPNFDLYIAQATEWWANHVLTGISPEYDEKKDAEILKVLRTNSLDPGTDITALMTEAEGLIDEINEATESIKDKEKRLKAINDAIKEHATQQFREGDKTVEVKGSKYVWSLARTEKEVTTYNDEALKADGVYDTYVTTSKNTSYRMTVNTIKN